MKPRYGILLACFAQLNVVLIKHYRHVIPQRDILACGFGMVGIFTVFALNHKGADIRPTERFHKTFNMLAFSEIFGTIILPWVLLCMETLDMYDVFLPASHKDGGMGYLLVPHLFYFQMQIVLECVIYVVDQKWLVLPFTCVANSYRIIPLMTWISRSVELLNESPETPQAIIMVLLPLIALTLWVYSTFVFIPLEWYPLLKSPPSSAPPSSSAQSSKLPQESPLSSNNDLQQELQQELKKA
mmetsp:Transcript_19397/g.21823  ORF Transcript_19397/g.21823 Transcript_19397/m.21823 type:complete len:242 (-) Transcript_19397:301-1026(-)